MIVGIDPGISGSVAVLSSDHQYVDHLLMPVMKLNKSNRVNGAALAAFLRNHEIKHAYLENVGARPGQGTRSMFTFGHSAGAAEAVLQVLGIPYTLVSPAAWKKAAGLTGKDKDAARSRAIQLYPGLRVLDLKTKGQAVADALLIARHGAE